MPGDSAGQDRIDWQELAILRRSRRVGDWDALRQHCEHTLETKVPDLRVALWWAEAKTNIKGFEGLTESVRRLSGLWVHFAEDDGNEYDGTEDEPRTEPVTIAVDALECCLLQASLDDRPSAFTFTTVINSRRDPDLAADIQRKVTCCRREHWNRLLKGMQEVEAELLGFQALTVRKSSLADPLQQLKKTIGEMRQTVAAWATNENGMEAKPADQDAEAAPAKEAGYAIHLWIEGVGGEDAGDRHEGWIECRAYKQSLKPIKTDESLRPVFEVEKNLDRSSPALYHAVHSGRIFDLAAVEVCRGTKQGARFLRVEMRDAIIVEVRQSAEALSESSRPTETIVFQYRQIQWTYTKLGADASREGNTSSAWTHSETKGLNALKGSN